LRLYRGLNRRRLKRRHRQQKKSGRTRERDSSHGLVAFTSSVVGFATGPAAVPKQSIGMLVSGNFFRVIGVEPELGRDFRPEEDQVPGRDAVVILGHDFWEQHFGADRSILGRTVRLNGIELTETRGCIPPGRHSRRLDGLGQRGHRASLEEPE
jgi:hypothetical protein